MKKVCVCFAFATLVTGGGAAAETIDAIPIAAPVLFAEYRANEVAADRKFKGRYLAVTGRVVEIGKDFMGDAYVALRTPNQFQPVRATLVGTEHDRAAQLKRGQEIVVLCKGAGMLIGSPVLEECRFVDRAQPKRSAPPAAAPAANRLPSPLLEWPRLSK